MKFTYWKGDKVEYTGKSEIYYGRRFFQIRLLEGHLKGELKDTSQCPDCGLKMGQDQPAYNICLTCTEIKGVNHD